MFEHILYHKVNNIPSISILYYKKSPHVNLSIVTVVLLIATCALTIHYTIRHITHNRSRCSHRSIN